MANLIHNEEAKVTVIVTTADETVTYEIHKVEDFIYNIDMEEVKYLYTNFLRSPPKIKSMSFTMRPVRSDEFPDGEIYEINRISNKS